MSYFPYYPGHSYPPPPGMTMEDYQKYLAQFNPVNQPPPPINTFPSQQSQEFYYSSNFSSQYSFQDQLPYFSNPDMRMPYYQPQHIPVPYSMQQFQPNQTHQLTQQKQRSRKSQKNIQKQIESAKKNSQSNIVNHFFSFFNSREKSEKIVQRSLQSFDKAKSQKQKLIHLFYNTIHVLSMRKGRKYVNRKNLINLLRPENLVKILPQIEGKVQKIKDITLQQLCKVFRKCCHSFLQTYSIDSIITSKRISPVVMEEHLRRRRKVRKAIQQLQ